MTGSQKFMGQYPSVVDHAMHLNWRLIKIDVRNALQSDSLDLFLPQDVK